MLRKFLIILALLVALLVAAVALLPVLLDKEQLLAAASEKLKAETGATLTVGGDIDLSFYPILGVALSDAAITLPEKSEPDLVVGALQIGVELMPLFSGEVTIDSIALDGLKLRSESAPEAEKVDTSKMSDAALDDFYTQRRNAREKAGSSAGAEAALAVPLALNVSRLIVTNARIELIDPETGATVLEIDRLEASGLNLEGKPIPIQLAMRLPGEQPIEIDLEGSMRVEEDTQLAHLDKVQVQIKGATAETVKLSLSGPVDMSRQTAQLKLQIDMGDTHGDGNLRYASFESPQIDADLHLNLLDPALLVLAGPEAAAAAPAEAGDGSLPLDAMRGIDTRAALRIDEARLGVHTISNMIVKLRAVEGIVTISTLKGELHGGQLDASATFDGRHNTAKLKTSGGLKGLDIGLAMAATESTTEVTGNATLQWQLSSSGKTTDELTTNMTGPIKLDTADVVLKGTNVEHLLCKSVALANQEQLTEPFGTDTQVKTLGMQIQLANGVAQLSPLQAQLPRLGLTGKGEYNIASGDLKARFNARLSPELEELDPACNISKRLTAIDFPVNCKGNTSGDPADWCTVDAEQIITDLAVNEGRKKIEKKASKYLNKWLEKQNEKEEEKNGN